ncbi:MAG: glycoside hydrolase family 65 protein [Chlorobia bacterium]|nr:glycoside hydrolase family 65 protein [Fimbriimonadaceae bacterium]
MRVITLALVGVLAFGCSSKPGDKPATAVKVAPVDPWIITNLDPSVQTPALLWNGLIGVRFGADGSAASKDGLSLFAIDNYQQKGEEKIEPLLNPSGFGFSKSFAIDRTKPYESRLDLRLGTFQASYWSLGGCPTTLECTIDPQRAIWGQRVTIKNAGGKEFSVLFQNTDAESPKERDPDLATWLIGPNGRKIRISTTTSGLAKKEHEFVRAGTRLNGVVDDAGSLTIERVYSLTPSENQPSFDQLLQAAGDKPGTTDIEIDGPVEDQQFIRSALFYLRGAIHRDGKMSVSPMGLSSDIYNGHVFWDADIWVFPALALIDPERAKAIPAYRLARRDRARENMAAWLMAGKPTGKGLMAQPTGWAGGPPAGTKYPWESSVSGKETVPGPSKFQDHITGSVAWSVSQAASLGLVSNEDAQRMRNGAAGFYSLRSQRANGLREIKGTMSPDENHIGDNDLYTNLLAQWATGQQYNLPKDDKSFLTYDNDALRGYKQAAAVLSIYPLQYPPAEKQARAMMGRFADKVTKNGPAMTDSIHSIIWARLGEKDKAYKAWHDSWKPFVKPPFLLFSEKRNSSRTYFTTGAAGSLQAVLYGFAGIRIDDKKAPGAQWSIPLKNGKVLSIAPNLPKEWKKLTLRNLTILGKKYTFEIVGDRVKVQS